MKFLPFKKKAPPADPEGRGSRGSNFGTADEKGGGKPPPSRLMRRFSIVSLSLATLVTLVQIGGILFRDTLEGRTPGVRSEPLLAAIGAATPKSHDEHRQAGKGFGVAEVQIGTPPGGHTTEHVEQPAKKEEHVKIEAHAKKEEHPEAIEPLKPKVSKKPLARIEETSKPPPPRKAPAFTKAAEPPKPQTPPKEPAANKPEKTASEVKTEVEAKQPERAVTQAKATGRERFKADPHGGYAVAVGAFNSPRLAQMMEQRLDDLGYPHLRISTMKEAEGYTLTLTAQSDAVLQNARKAMLDNGYKLEKAEEGFSTRFFTEDEATRAKAIAERGGALASIKKATGQTPLWRILVGPTTAQNASKAQEVLKGEGIDCVTVRYKP